MTQSINLRLSSNGSQVSASPDGFLDRDSFSAYLSACRSAGARYDAVARGQVIGVEQLAALSSALLSAGFTPAPDPRLRSMMSGVAEALEAEAAEAEEAMAAADQRVAASGFSLFPYQRDGVRYLAARRSALLADEMGLGKTVQALAAISGPALVICPSALKHNWRAECRRWRSDLSPVVLGGRGSFRWPEAGELVIINDDVLASTKGQIPTPPSGVTVIYDECHRAKNPKTKRTQAAREILQAALDARGAAWLMTGTPLVNRPQELWAVLQLADLGREAYGSWAGLVKAFRGTRTQFGWEWGTPGPEAAAGLRRVALRREREDVLKDLPGKLYGTVEVDLDAATISKLDAIQAEIEAATGKAMAAVTLKDLEAPVLFENMSRIRALLARAKLAAAVAIAEEHEEAGEPLVVFSAHREPVDALASREGWARISGSESAEAKQAAVEAFQAGELKGLAITIRAGGVGLTLTRACRCLFIDLDWTPAGNSQAEDRLYRIGQERPVLVTTLVADHEMDRRVAELLGGKQRIIQGSVVEAARGEQRQADELLEAKRQLAEAARRAANEALERTAQVIADKAQAGGKVLELGTRLAALGPTYYAIPGDNGRPLDFYVADVGTSGGRWAGYLFLRQQAGPEVHTVVALHPSKGIHRTYRQAEALVSVMERILANPEEAALRYGREIGKCCRCGRALTDADSRALGIGPDCRTRTAW